MDACDYIMTSLKYCAQAPIMKAGTYYLWRLEKWVTV